MEQSVANCPPCVEYSPKPPTERKFEKRPVERVVMVDEEYEYEEQVEKKVKKIIQEEVTKIDYRPVERKIIQYFAVETTRAYMPQVEQVRSVKSVPVERQVTRINYKPVTREINHGVTETGVVNEATPYRSIDKSTVPSTNVTSPFNSLQLPASTPRMPTNSVDPLLLFRDLGYDPNAQLSGDQLADYLVRARRGQPVSRPMMDRLWNSSPDHSPQSLANSINGLLREDPQFRSWWNSI